MIFALCWMIVGACTVIAIYCGVQSKRHAERVMELDDWCGENFGAHRW